jgi:hypothetical protein
MYIRPDSSLAFGPANDQADDAGFELVGELATGSLWCAGHRSGHRIPHKEDVHESGSSALPSHFLLHSPAFSGRPHAVYSWTIHSRARST